MTRSKVSRYAKIDPAHLSDGLFVPVAKKGEALYDVFTEWKDGIVAFKGVQLDAVHQSLLLAIAARTARAGSAALRVKGSDKDLRAQQLLLPLKIEGKASEGEYSTVHTTAYSLLTDAGMEPNAAGYKRLKSLLTDMGTVAVMRDYKGNGGVSHLLSASWKEDGTVEVTLNWRMTDAIFGGQNIQVSLHERHALGKGEFVAQILHAWFSGFIRLGAHLMAGKGAEIDTLVRHVWGKRPCSDKVLRDRRMRVRAALERIGSLEGWTVRIEGTHVFISRPKELPWNGDDVTPGELKEFEQSILDDIHDGVS